MRTLSFVLLGAALFVFFAFSCGQKEQEQEVTASEVPKAVIEAFNQAYPGATVKGYTREVEDQQTFYEVSCEFEGRKIDALYKLDGTIAEIEEAISAEQLPDTVSQAITAEVPQCSLQVVEKIQKQGKTLYEVKLMNTADRKKYEMVFSDTGELMEKEQIAGKEE